MIRNYCTTVPLIWFQGGFDALLYSFLFEGQQILHICCCISPQGGVVLNATATVKHYIKYRLHLAPCLLYPVIYPRLFY